MCSPLQERRLTKPELFLWYNLARTLREKDQNIERLPPDGKLDTLAA
jgi:hypothetical protein